MFLVVGSTGLLGGMIARRLLDKGTPLRVLVRSGTTDLEGAEAVQGDLKDRPSLHAACSGVTTVITSANSAQRGGDDNVATVDTPGNISLIDAARQSGVRRFVFISAAAVDEASPVPLFAAKARAERHLRESGMEWTIVAPRRSKQHDLLRREISGVHRSEYAPGVAWRFAEPRSGWREVEGSRIL